VTSRGSLLLQRGVWRALALLTLLGATSQACDQRFEFDALPAVGGSTGALSGAANAGTSLGGASAGSGGSSEGGGSAGGSGGVAALGGAGTAGSGGLGGAGGSGGLSGNSSSSGSDDGGAGEGSQACGTLAACPAGLHCTGDLCSQCATDADCAPFGLPRCETTRHRCVACLATADCDAGFACDPLANRCLQSCKTDANCPAGAHGCDERRLVCYQCDDSEECAGSSLGHLCASDGSGCVQCLKETDCPGQHCDQLGGRCVDCRDGRDCPSQLCDATTLTCLPP